jgi:hypothetical protein
MIGSNKREIQLAQSLNKERKKKQPRFQVPSEVKPAFNLTHFIEPEPDYAQFLDLTLKTLQISEASISMLPIFS